MSVVSLCLRGQCDVSSGRGRELLIGHAYRAVVTAG